MGQHKPTYCYTKHTRYWHRYPPENWTLTKPVYTMDQFEFAVRELFDTVAAAVYGPASSLSAGA